MTRRIGKEIKTDLIKSIGLSCDEPLSRHGFLRRGKSINYIRRFGETKQTIVINYSTNPHYQSEDEIHIYPHMHLSIKSVCEATLKLVGGDERLLAGAPDIIMNQPIEFAAPKESHTRWFASGYSEINRKVLEIVPFIEKWVVPVFDEMKSAKDLIGVYRNNDDRVIKQQHWYLYVAGAELVQGNPEAARAVLEANLGSTGLRKCYAIAFETLQASTNAS